MRTVSRSSYSRSAPSAGGTMGGMATAVGPRPGKRSNAYGDEVYLWILVIAEAALVGVFRSIFARYHGG